MSRQAAAKTVHTLETLGYVERANDAADGRRNTLHVSPAGIEMARLGRAAFDDIRSRLIARLGAARVDELETTLESHPALGGARGELMGPWLGAAHV